MKTLVHLLGYCGFFALLGHSIETRGQFTFNASANNVFMGLTHCGSAFGDVNGDGLPDAVISGQSSTLGNAETLLYINLGMGNFAESSTFDPVRVSFAAVAMADVDGDLDLDILISGRNGLNGPRTMLYLNDGPGNGTVWSHQDENNTGFISVEHGSITFGNFVDDAQGLPDVLITGFSPIHGFRADVYENGTNNGGLWVRKDQLVGVARSSSAAGHFNNDGLIDLVIGGEELSNGRTRIYRSNGDGTFALDSDNLLPQEQEGTVLAGDFLGNEDGLDDVFICGTGIEENVNAIYENIGGTFQLLTNTPDFIPVGYSPAALGDFDDDGLPDLAVSGDEFGSYRFKTFQNEIPSSSLNRFPMEQLLIPAVINGSMSVADVDGDCDIDLLVLGETLNGNYTTTLYLNGNGSAPCTELEMSMTTDANGTAMRWQIRRANCATPVIAFSDYANDASCNTNTFCLPDGDYVLDVFNDNGGSFNGSYVLRSIEQGRVVDNPDGFQGNSASIEFSLPMSSVRPQVGPDKRDVMDLLAGGDLRVVGSNTTQCDWMVFDPDGGAAILFPNQSQTLTVNAMLATELIVPNRIYNFRASNPAGVFGQASTFRIVSTTPPPCPKVRLVDRPVNGAPIFPETQSNYVDEHSCDITLTSPDQFVFATRVNSYAHYRLELTCVSGDCAGDPPIYITHAYQNNTENSRRFRLNGQPGPSAGGPPMPNTPDGGAAWPTSYSGGSTWMIRAQSKRNTSSTWCPYGQCCRVIIPAALSGEMDKSASSFIVHSPFNIWPNPNNGNEVLMDLSAAKGGAITVAIFDGMGRLAFSSTIPNDGSVDLTTYRVSPALKPGMHIVRVESGGEQHTAKLVVE